MSLRATFCWDIIIMAAGVGGGNRRLGPGVHGGRAPGHGNGLTDRLDGLNWSLLFHFLPFPLICM